MNRADEKTQSTNKRTSEEDPVMEGEQPKRIRQIGHVDGNWPSFAYILGM